MNLLKLLKPKPGLAGLIAGLGLAVAGCHRETQPANPVVLPTVTVTVARVGSASLQQFDSVSGSIVPRVQSVLEAKVVGRISSLNVELGQAVRAGQPLLKLEAPEIQARVEQATAGFQLAEREGRRVQNLFARQAATQSELDAATAQLRQARAALDEANAMLGYLTIVAPLDGVISRKWMDVGDLAAPGKPLIEIEQPGNKRFEAAVSEALIDRLKVGGAATVLLTGIDAPIAATVGEIEPAGDPASRSWLVKFNLPGDSEFRSGTFGRVTIPRGEREAINVPVSAVIQRGQLEQVFVVTNGHAWLRLVRTGKVSADGVEVLSGLQPGETVVMKPGSELKDGQPVTLP